MRPNQAQLTNGKQEQGKQYIMNNNINIIKERSLGALSSSQLNITFPYIDYKCCHTVQGGGVYSHLVYLIKWNKPMDISST